MLSSLKWPIETLYAGMRPQFNIANPVISGLTVTSGDINQWRDWHRFTRNVPQTVQDTARAEVIAPFTNADPTALTPANIGTNIDGANRVSSQVTSRTWTWWTRDRPFTTIGIEAHGIRIYDDYESRFFDSYQPYNYGGWNIAIDKQDQGAVMINFCLYPGTYQPSGHINVSRAREFYFRYTSAYVGAVDVNDPIKYHEKRGFRWNLGQNPKLVTIKY